MSKTAQSDKFRISEATTKRLWAMKKDEDLVKSCREKMGKNTNEKELQKITNKNKGQNILK